MHPSKLFFKKDGLLHNTCNLCLVLSSNKQINFNHPPVLVPPFLKRGNELNPPFFKRGTINIFACKNVNQGD
jgi:hypothetical protein